MDERVMRFRVGVVAFATILVACTLVLLIGGMPSALSARYPLLVTFPDAPGVAKDTPVRKFGLRIGQVSDVGFADDGSGAVVMVEIDSGVDLRTDESFRINRGVLGDAVLEVYDTDPEKTPPTFWKSGDEPRGTVRRDPLDIAAKLEGSLADTLASIAKTSTEIGDLASRVNELLGNNEEQVVRIVDKMEKTIDRLSSVVATTDELLSDPVLKENLKRTISDLPEILTDAREAIGGLKTALTGVDRNLANLEGLTRPLGERGGALVGSFENAIAKLDQVLNELAVFSAALNDEQSSLNQLMSSPDVYQQINEAATNFNQLTKELRPIVADARIFTDRLAREGLHSALERPSGTKRTPQELGLQRGPAPPLLPFLKHRHENGE